MQFNAALILMIPLMLASCQFMPERSDTRKSQIFIQRVTEPNYPAPDTIIKGRFQVQGDCLVFETYGGVFRAVMPRATRFVGPDTLALPDGTRWVLGTEVTVKGGEGNYDTASIISSSCPSKAAIISGEGTA